MIQMLRHRTVGLTLFLVLVIAGIVYAQDAILRYRTVEPAPALYLDDDDGTSATLDYEAPENARATNGDPTVAALVEFSNVGATATLEILGYHLDSSGTTYSYMGVCWVGTVTASTSRVKGSAYVPEIPVTADTYGAAYIDARVRDVSAGTVDVRLWNVGNTSSGKSF